MGAQQHVVAYISHPAPDFTTVFCWLGWVGRKLGWNVSLLYSSTNQRVRCVTRNSFLYPVNLIPLPDIDLSTLSADWYVFFFSHSSCYPGFEKIPPPRRGAILLFASSVVESVLMGLVESWRVAWRESISSRMFTFNLEKEPNVAFCCMPPEAALCTHSKIRNAILFTTANYDYNIIPSSFVEDLCNKLSDAHLWAVALDYDREVGDGSFPITATPLGFASFLPAFRWWVHIAPPMFVDILTTSSANFEVLLARAAGVHLITNLVIPAHKCELSYVHYIPTITFDAILQKIKELEASDAPTESVVFDEVIQEIDAGCNKVLQCFNVDGHP